MAEREIRFSNFIVNVMPNYSTKIVGHCLPVFMVRAMVKLVLFVDYIMPLIHYWLNLVFCPLKLVLLNDCCWPGFWLPELWHTSVCTLFKCPVCGKPARMTTADLLQSLCICFMTVRIAKLG